MSEPLETLHSVKWYRIDHNGNMEDFFTYSPHGNPQIKTYPRTGIKVDVNMFHYNHAPSQKFKGNGFDLSAQKLKRAESHSEKSQLANVWGVSV